MSGRVCIVTGANTGMGKETARALARLGASVVMVCRDRERGEAAAREIRDQQPDAALDLTIADFSSLDSVRSFAGEVNARYDQIHVLVNNAGVLMDRRIETVDGYEMTFAVNYLAPFVLTHELLPALYSGSPARIVNVVSGAHRMGKLDFGDLQSNEAFRGFRGAYAQSKLAVVIFTYDLANRLAGTGVTANAADPGGTKTSTKMPGLFALFRPFFQSADRGAETTVWAASDPDLEAVTGKYFNKKKEKRSAPMSYDEEIARRLREVSLNLTGVEELDLEQRS